MRGYDVRFIEELKNKNDIVDVVSRYVRLEQRGGSFWGKCPFHHEKTASFSVNSAGQFFYCFGCHKSGDVITFISEIESLDFNDSVKFLAERAKIPLPEVRYDDEKIKEQKKRKEKVLQILKDTAYFYAHNLKSSRATKHVEYIFKRKITPETVAKFGFGASLDFSELPNYLLKKGYTYEEMLDSGAVDVKDGRYFDSLGGRLIVPIINQFNQVIAFGGRLLENADFAKYKNTRETIAFSKSNNLYNLNNLKKLKNEKGLDSIIIVEGYMDTISLVQAGIENVVASMGTALTKDQARILKRYSDKVYISYDGDFAGQKAAIRGLEILKDEGLDVKIVSLPNGMDPDDVVKQFKKEGYEKLLLEAKPLIDFKLDVLKKTFDVNSVDGKRKYIANAIKVIRESPSAAEQEDLLKTVREYTGTTFEALRRDLYNTKEDIKPKKIDTPSFSDNSGDKTVIAARFILYAYLFNKAFTSDYDIEEIEFILPIHKKLKDYVLECKNQNRTVRFSDLYEELEGEEHFELSKIAGLETDDNKRFDQALYFEDCIKTLKAFTIGKNIEILTAQFKKTDDVELRKELTQKISKLLIEKNKLK